MSHACWRQCKDSAESVYEFAAYTVFQGLTNAQIFNSNSTHYLLMKADESKGELKMIDTMYKELVAVLFHIIRPLGNILRLIKTIKEISLQSAHAVPDL